MSALVSAILAWESSSYKPAVRRTLRSFLSRCHGPLLGPLCHEFEGHGVWSQAVASRTAIIDQSVQALGLLAISLEMPCLCFKVAPDKPLRGATASLGPQQTELGFGVLHALIARRGSKEFCRHQHGRPSHVRSPRNNCSCRMQRVWLQTLRAPPQRFLRVLQAASIKGKYFKLVLNTRLRDLVIVIVNGASLQV